MLWVQSPTGIPATHGSCIGSGGRNRTCVGCVQSHAANDTVCFLAEAERVERSRPLRIIVGFAPTKHATCEPLNWRRADHSKVMPQDGTHRLATA